jgi:hypothetical protein
MVFLPSWVFDVKQMIKSAFSLKLNRQHLNPFDPAAHYPRSEGAPSVLQPGA